MAFQSSSTIAPLGVVVRWRKHVHQLTRPVTSGQIVSRAKVLLRMYSQWFRKSMLAKSPLHAWSRQQSETTLISNESNTAAAAAAAGGRIDSQSVSASRSVSCSVINALPVCFVCVLRGGGAGRRSLPVHVNMRIDILQAPRRHPSRVMQRCIARCGRQVQPPRNITR